MMTRKINIIVGLLLLMSIPLFSQKKIQISSFCFNKSNVRIELLNITSEKIGAPNYYLKINPLTNRMFDDNYSVIGDTLYISYNIDPNKDNMVQISDTLNTSYHIEGKYDEIEINSKGIIVFNFKISKVYKKNTINTLILQINDEIYTSPVRL